MSQLEELDKVLDEADSELSTVNDLQTLQQKKANFLGKKGPIASVMMALSTVATIFSGWDYVWKGRSLFTDKKDAKEAK